MGTIYQSMTELIGRTPLLAARRFEKANDLAAKLLVKLEYFNPSGSVKDRIAAAMIEDAEKRGVLTAESVIIEPTSGNTGIGLASVAAARGYRAILTMPETMSVERRNLLKAYGAEIVLTDGAKGMKGAIEKSGNAGENHAARFFTVAVYKPCQSGGALGDNGTGDLGGQRRISRSLCRGGRHGGNGDRRGALSSGEEARSKNLCRRAAGFACLERRRPWTA